jgi:hypothetical protein
MMGFHLPCGCLVAHVGSAVGRLAADQLRNIGITASVSALDPVVLYGDALINNRVDAVVGRHQAGGDLATALASRYAARRWTPRSSRPGPNVQNVSLSVPVGMVGDAGKWVKTPR